MSGQTWDWISSCGPMLDVQPFADDVGPTPVKCECACWVMTLFVVVLVYTRYDFAMKVKSAD